MSSYYYGDGLVRMNPEIEENEKDCGGYPFKIPEVYLYGEGVYDYKFPMFDKENDSVILVRDKCILEYRSLLYREMLLKNSNGEAEWVDSKMIEKEEYENMEFLGEVRVAKRYNIIEYDVEKREKRTYSVLWGKSAPMTTEDCYRLSDIVDKEMLGNCFEIKDAKYFSDFYF